MAISAIGRGDPRSTNERRSARQWVVWADNLNPNPDLPPRQALRDAFVKHMGAATVDARRLSWDEYEDDMLARSPA